MPPAMASCPSDAGVDAGALHEQTGMLMPMGVQVMSVMRISVADDLARFGLLQQDRLDVVNTVPVGLPPSTCTVKVSPSPAFGR